MTAVSFDGQPQQLRPEKGELPLSLAPGEHSFADRLGRVARREPAHAAVAGGPADARPATSRRTCSCPTRAGSLCGVGTGRGPGGALLGRARGVHRGGVAARALGEVAAALRRMAAARARTLDAVVVRVLAHRGVADAMRWREGWQPAATFARWRFNAVQVRARGVHLRHHPHAGVLGHSQRTAGAARHAHRRNRRLGTAATAGSRTRPPASSKARASISVPMWVYRALFFAWATLDGVRAGGLAALGVQRVEGERPVARGDGAGEGIPAGKPG